MDCSRKEPHAIDNVKPGASDLVASIFLAAIALFAVTAFIIAANLEVGGKTARSHVNKTNTARYNTPVIPSNWRWALSEAYTADTAGPPVQRLGESALVDTDSCPSVTAIQPARYSRSDQSAKPSAYNIPREDIYFLQSGNRSNHVDLPQVMTGKARYEITSMKPATWTDGVGPETDISAALQPVSCEGTTARPGPAQAVIFEQSPDTTKNNLDLRAQRKL